MDKTALILVIVGALNWGLVSLFKFDLVASLFGGSTSLISRIIYGIIYAVENNLCTGYTFEIFGIIYNICILCILYFL